MSKPPFKCLYDNDLTNLIRAARPEWRKPGAVGADGFESAMDLTDAMIEGGVEDVAGTGVDVHKLSPGHFWVAWWKSRSAPAEDHYRWFEASYGKPPDAYGRYMLAGGDMVEVFVRHCRRFGQAPFLSMRLNQVQAVKQHARQLNWTRWMEAHPEYALNEPGTPSTQQRRLNWMIPAVRRHFLTFADELCAYDIDGFELDFTRHTSLFRLDQTTRQQREEIVTDFVMDVRRILDSHRRGRQRRWLCIKVPCHLVEHTLTGLNVERLVTDAGVDMVNVSPSFFTQQQTDLPAFRAMLPDSVGLYLEMSDCIDNAPPFGKRWTTDEQFYTTAHLAYARGADGVSLFNFVYYRQWDGYGRQGSGERIVQPVPFHVLRHLHDPRWLARRPQHWFLARGYGGYDPRFEGSGKMMINARETPRSPFPALIEPGERVVISADIAPPAGDRTAGTGQGRNRLGRCRIQAVESLGDRVFRMELNGETLSPTPDVTELYRHSYKYREPGPLGHPDDWRAWTVPVALIKAGENRFVLTLISGVPARWIYMDLAMPAPTG